MGYVAIAECDTPASRVSVVRLLLSRLLCIALQCIVVERVAQRNITGPRCSVHPSQVWSGPALCVTELHCTVGLALTHSVTASRSFFGNGERRGRPHSLCPCLRLHFVGGLRCWQDGRLCGRIDGPACHGYHGHHSHGETDYDTN